MGDENLNFVDSFSPYVFEKFGYIRLPNIEITKEERELSSLTDKNLNHELFLRSLVETSFSDYLSRSIIPRDRKQDYIDRIERELSTFFELKFTDYVLLVWKVINFCNEQNIMTDFGRGSGGGSLVFYLLKITQIDPIKYELFFERFISKARAKSKIIDGELYIDGSLAPDYDLDVQIEKRSDVVEYLRSLYKNRVCKITTFTTLSSKIVIKECGKIVLGKSEDEMKGVSETIAKNHGILEDIDVSYEQSKPFKLWVDENKKAFVIALKLRDLIKNYGVHASGFVVAYDEFDEFLPLRYTKDKDLATAYEMHTVSSLTIKLDILGVRSLSVVNDVLQKLKIDWRLINIDNDETIYSVLQAGLKHSHGIFQLEADCNFQVCNSVKPKNISELSDVIAIARPGALAFAHDYVNNSKSGLHPLFDPILKATRYTILYQEQLMKLANVIGFSLEESEILRKVVGKKLVKEVGEWKEKINTKIKENNLPEELGTLLWETLEASSKYSFNKSHSIAYAALAALTIYLKYKYPLHFFIALLNQCKNEQDSLGEVGMIERELSDFNIKLLRPHLIKSDMSFSIEDGNIRYGLESIKGVSEKSIEKLLTFKTKYDDKFQLFEAAKQSGLSIGILASLIQAGALEDEFSNVTRSKAVLEAQLYNILTPREKKFVFEHKDKVGNDLIEIIKYLKSKNIIKEKRLETIREKYKKYNALYKINVKHEKLANYLFERKMLGYSYSCRLKDIFTEDRNLAFISEVINGYEKETFSFVGIVKEVKTGKANNAKKTRWCRFEVADEKASINVMLFNDDIDKFRTSNNEKLADKEDILYVKGAKMGDAVFARDITVQDQKVFFKINELKDE